MAQRRHHYEAAFESYLRAGRIPYVAVDEAKKALLPASGSAFLGGRTDGEHASLKSFDFVLYGQGANLLVEVKGRRAASRRLVASSAAAPDALGRPAFRAERTPPRHTAPPAARMDSWVTREDVDSLARWEVLFGPAFEAAFVFIYWCEDQPPDALFHETFEHKDRWYAVRAVRLRDYRAAMRTRSESWGTVDVPKDRFAAMCGPLADAVGAIGLPVLDKL